MTAITSHFWLTPEKIRCGEAQEFHDALRELTGKLARIGYHAKDFHPDLCRESAELYADLSEDLAIAFADCLDAAINVADGHVTSRPESVRENMREIITDRLFEIREQIAEWKGEEA